MRREYRERFSRHRLQRKPLVSDPGRHHGTCVTHARAVMHVGIANPRWQGKRSLHSRRIRNPEFYVSDKKPIQVFICFIYPYQSWLPHWHLANPRWRHQMETFFALLALCEKIHRSPVDSQRPVRRSFDVFFDLRLNKRLSKQSRRRRFETPLRSLWGQCNVHDYP